MSEDFAKKHNTIKDNLLWLCRKHPSVMVDYRRLVQYYWYYVNDLKVFIPIEQLNKLTNPESIGRAFRKLVEEGELVVPSPVLDARSEEEAKYRRYYKK